MTDNQSPEPHDTCRTVEIDGETVRVRGAAEMNSESQAALAEVIAAAKRKYLAEHPPTAVTDPARRERYAEALYATLEVSPTRHPWETLSPLRRQVWYDRADAAMALADKEIAAAVPAPPPPAVWVDGHPQLEAIAAAVWEQCEHHDSGLVIDDPRNIAVAALAAVSPPPAGQTAEPVCKDSAGCHRVVPCTHGCGTRDLLTEATRPLPPPVDRAAILCDAADIAYRRARRLDDQQQDQRAQGAWDVENELRSEARMAAGTQQTDTEARHVGGRVNAEDCPACCASPTPPPYPWICPGEPPAAPSV